MALQCTLPARSVTAAAVLACLCGALAAGEVQAGGLRCEDQLVQEGFTFVEVLERCGAPAFETQRPEWLVPGVVVFVDEWTYELGRNRFRRLLTFENGRLVRIETRPKPERRIEDLALD